MFPGKGVLAFVFCHAIQFSGFGQHIAGITLTVPPGRVMVPVRINLDEITFVADSSLRLLELAGGKKTAVPVQIAYSGHREMCWLVPAGAATRNLSYELVKEAPTPGSQVIPRFGDGTLTLESGKRHLLRYQYGTVYPPAGIDSAYKRSGFIHPLWSPHGQELTRIQPKDHYHHYGIWNPWTHVLYEGDTVDFWNLRSKKGLVRFAKFISTTGGNVFAEYKALHEHEVLRKGGGKKVALNELQTVRVYNPQQEDYYLVDMTFEMSCATSSPVRLLKYRYGGLGWRTTGEWTKDNSEVLSSEGRTRKDADGSRARWCIVQGSMGDDYAGVVMMSHPANYNHPEPLRIWPENMYDRGDMFANFSPTKDMDWLLEPGRDYVLRYRLVVFNGRLTREVAESAWQSFVSPPRALMK